MRPFQPDGIFRPIAKGRGLRRTAVRGAGVSVAGQAASFVLQIGSVAVLSRLLTPADFGIVTMVTTFGLLFRSFGLNGFTELILQWEELTGSLASNIFWINLSIGTILTLVFAGLGPLLARFFHSPAVTPVTAGLSLMIVFSSMGWIHLALLQRAMHFRTASVINLVAFISYVIVAVGLAMADWHYWALVWAMVTQSLVTTAGAWLACRWLPGRPGRVSGTGPGLKFAMNVYLHFAFSYLTRNADNLLVGWRFGAGALGFYKKAYDLFVLPQSQLLAPLSAVVVATLSRVNSDRERFQRYFLRAISVLALVGMGLGADFALVGKDLIRFLLGPGWEEAGRIFSLFGPGIGVMLLYSTHGWVHLSIGRPERWFRWGLLEFVCTVCLFLLGLRWGPSGIALAWTISYFILMFPGFWYAGKPIGLGIGPVFGAIWKFFAASALAGGVTALIVGETPHFATAFGASGAFVRMVFVSLVFFALYLVGVILLHNGLQPIHETLGLIRDLLPEKIVTRMSSATLGEANVLSVPARSGEERL